MDESLAWLRAPETQPALVDLLCGLIRDIRLILRHADLAAAAKLGAITETVDQLDPPSGPAASGAQAAASVVALLARNTGPATLLFERLAGEQIQIELTAAADRPLTLAECRDLHLDPGASGHERVGTLRAAGSGLVAAEVWSVVVAGRLPAAARAALGIPGPGEPAPPPTGVPLGKALAGFGVRREPLGARLIHDGGAAADGPMSGGRVSGGPMSGGTVSGGPVSGGTVSGDGVPGDRLSGAGVSVRSSARMWLADLPVALAGERVTSDLCARAAARRVTARAAG